MTAEKLRKVRGGVIGCFTPKETVVDIAENAAMGAVGDNAVGIKVPAGKFVYGAYFKADDALASGGAATVSVKVGTDAVVAATALATAKNNGVAALEAAPVYDADEREVFLTVATAALTAGKVTVGVIYG